MIKRLESLPCEKRQNELGLFSLEKTLEGPYHSIPALKGLLQGEWRLSLLKEPHGEDKWQWVQIAQGEVSSSYNEHLLWWEQSLTGTNSPRNQVELEVFKMWLDRVLHNLIKAPFSMKDWTWRCFEVTSSLGCSMIQWSFWEVLVSFFFHPDVFAFGLDCCGTKTLGWGRQIWKQIHCCRDRNISELQRATSIPPLGDQGTCVLSLNSLMVQRQWSFLDGHFLDKHLRYHHLLWKIVETGFVESRDSQYLFGTL